MKKLIKWFINKIKPDKHPIDNLLDELSKLDQTNPDHFIQLCCIYSELSNGYGIRYHYKKDMWGNKVYDPYDYQMAEKYDKLSKQFRLLL